MRDHCTVVGMGDFGLASALRIRRECKMDVTAIMPQPPKTGILRMDSVRNHSWYQSGLLYDWLSDPAAVNMGLSLKAWHTAVGYPLPDPSQFGVFRVDETSEAKLLAAAERLGLQIWVLPENEARKLLRDFYEPGFKHYAVPDRPFDGAGLLTATRRVAEEEGVRFRAAEVVKLVEDAGSASGISLVLNVGPGKNVIWRSDYVVLGAGSMIPSLLATIDAKHPLQVFQSVLLTVPNNRYLDAPLFVDRVSDLSVVRHSVIPGVLPSGALVVGGRFREPVRDPAASREVSESERRALVRLMPSSLWCLAQSTTATAGHKTERVDESGKSSVAPFVTNVPGYQRVLYGVPGKATLAYRAAGLVVNQLQRLQRSRSRAPILGPTTHQNEHLPELMFEYRMHHTMRVDETRVGPLEKSKNL